MALQLIIHKGKKNAPSGIGTYVDLLVTALQETSFGTDIIYKTPTYFSHYPVAIKQTKKNILHITSQDLALPLLFTSYHPLVVTVHDIIPLEYPLFQQATHLRWKALDLWLFRKTIQSLKKADAIVAVSQATKNALLRHTHMKPEKIHVIYEYAQEHFTCQKKKRESNTVLYVGSEMPYKNLPTLFHAIAIVKKKIKDIKLIKVGSSKWPGSREQLQTLAQSLGITENIIWKDTTKDLCTAYNTATLLVQPSLYEGFGLPVIEAMACGCPVLSSNRTSLPEVGGNAAEYFDPTTPEACAEKIIAILQDKNKQEQMRKEGFQNCKRFSKEQFARQIDAVYKEVLGNKNQ